MSVVNLLDLMTVVFEQSVDIQSNTRFMVENSSDSRFVYTSISPVPVGYFIRAITPTLGVPTNLSSSVEAGPTIILDWTQPPGVLNYRVFYSPNANFDITDDGVFQADVFGSNEFRLSQSVQPGQTLFFRVASLVGGEIGQLSEPLDVTVPLTPPLGSENVLLLQANARSDGNVALTWSSPVNNDAISFEIFRGVAPEFNPISIATITRAGNPRSFRLRQFIDTGVNLSTEYRYWVNFSNFLSPPNSPNSLQADVRTPDVVVENNDPPITNAGGNQTVISGDIVFLNGASSIDPEGDTLQFTWAIANSGGLNVSISNADEPVANLVAPTVTIPTDLTISLSTFDGISTTTEFITVTVVPRTNSSLNGGPVVSAFASAQEATPGDNITLDASRSRDSDGNPLLFLWRQVDTSGIDVGITNSTTPVVSFVAPSVASDTTLVFLVEVSDGQSRSSQSVEVLVRGAGIAASSGLTLDINASSLPLNPDTPSYLEFFVRNNSASQIDNVVLSLVYPDGVLNQSASFPFLIQCNSSEGRSNSICESSETVTWSLGTLQSGEVSSRILRVFYDSEITNLNNVLVQASVIGGQFPIVTANELLSITNSKNLHITIASSEGFATPDSPINYDINWGYSGVNNILQDVVLEVNIPQGYDLRRTSIDNFSQQSGFIEIDIGQLRTGDQGQFRIELIPNGDNNLRNSTQLTATITDRSTNVTAVANNYVPIVNDVDFRLVMASDQEPWGVGELFHSNIQAFNENNLLNLQDLSIQEIYPTGIFEQSDQYVLTGGDCVSVVGSASICNPGERVFWNYDLNSDSSLFIPRIYVPRSDVLPGQIIEFVSNAYVGESFRLIGRAKNDIGITESSQIDISINNENLPLRSVDSSVDINYGVGSLFGRQINESSLEVQLPDSIQITRISDQGVEVDNKIIWELGTLSPGDTGFRSFNYSVDTTSDSLVRLTSDIKSDLGGRTVAQGNEVVPLPVGFGGGLLPNSILDFELSLSKTSIVPGQDISFASLTVKNLATFQSSDLQIRLVIPDELTAFSENYLGDSGLCSSIIGSSSTCNPSETIIWNIGRLSSLESTNVNVPLFLDSSFDTSQSVPLNAYIFNINNNQVVNRSEKSLQLVRESSLNVAINYSGNPINTSDSIPLSIDYGFSAVNRIAENATVELIFPNTLTASSVDASGTIDNNRITWQLGNLSPGQSGELNVTFIRGDTESQELMNFDSRIAANDEFASSSEVTLATTSSLVDAGAFDLRITAPESASPGQGVNIVLSITNNGRFSSSDDILMEFNFPSEFNVLPETTVGETVECFGFNNRDCTGGEKLTLNAGVIASGETVNLSIPAVINSSVRPGTVIILEAEAEVGTTFVTEAKNAIRVN